MTRIDSRMAPSAPGDGGAAGGGSWFDRALGWFLPVLPEARVAILRSVVYVFVLLDIHLLVRDPIPLSHQPELYRPLLLARLLHLPPPSVPLAWGLDVVLWVSCLVAASNRLPRVAGWVVAAAFTWWTAIGMSRLQAAAGRSASAGPSGGVRRRTRRCGEGFWHPQY